MNSIPLNRLLKDGSVRIGGGTLVLLIGLGLCAPWLGTVAPDAMDAMNIHRAALDRGTMVLPEGDVERVFWMGTDGLGRDLGSRILYGTRVSLAVGLACSLLALTGGALIGLVAGYFRAMDLLVMRLMDGMMAIPAILLAITLVAALGASLATVIVSIAIPEVPRVARLVRSLVLTLREEAFVEAARALATPSPIILWRHVLPNAMVPLIVNGTFIAASAIITESALSFLGLGLPADIPTWGGVMAEGRVTFSQYPSHMLYPALLLVPTVLAINLLGDGLRTFWTRSSVVRERCMMAETTAARSGPVLEIERLDVALPPGADRPMAVRQLSLSIGAGRTLCVVGESGSGKSILARTVMGLLPSGLQIEAGDIRLDGDSLLQATPARWRAIRGARAGLVFQEPMTALNPVMRCGDQIEELLREHTDWDAGRREASVREVAELVRLPDPDRMLRSFPHQLSGGQRQRIVIAMAVVLKPRLLICDEPTTALDVTTQKSILELIRDLQQRQGSAVLMITHDMGVVAEMADEVLVMRHGQAVEHGTKNDILGRPRAAYTRALLSAVPSMVPPPSRPRADGPALLRAEAVAKTYSTRNWFGRRIDVGALQASTLAVHAGETLGIVGESGCGKSTLARCLVRLIEPSGGQVFWGGDEVRSLAERRLRPIRSRVQVVFQDPNRSLNPRRRVGDSLIEGAVNFGVPSAEAKARALTLLRLVRLPESALDRYPSEFSGGQRQRIAIARALACRPQVLVADEAVSALDVSVQADILSLLRDVQAQLGLGLIFITHDLRVAAQLCDRVVVMHDGRIVEEGRTADVYKAPAHEYTRQLLAAAPGTEAAVRRNDDERPAANTLPLRAA